jgi:hypothetical protein
MPQRKKTRTTSTRRLEGVPSPPRNIRKIQQIRRDIAFEAARIMATEGQHNFMAAKRKAAERIGASPRLALPSNIEVEEALRAYQELYGGERHKGHLLHLREVALFAMRALDRFCPRLVGPVLDGTADAHSRVSLHLFSDPPDAIAMHLQDQGVNYRQEQRKIRWHDGGHRTIQLLVADVDGTSVEMALFEAIDLRQAPPSPVDGRPQRRARVVEVENLLAA